MSQKNEDQKRKDSRLEGESANASQIGYGEVYRDFMDAMWVSNFKLMPSETGIYAGHDVYVRRKLSVRNNVSIWRNIASCGTLERNLYMRTLVNVRNDLLKPEDKEYTEILCDICDTLMTKPRLKNTRTYGYACNLMSESPEFSRSISGEEAFKHIPQKSWFPQLAGLSPYDLLTLFPKPEAQTMLLLLGRVVCGAKGTKIDGRPIHHKARTAAVVVGLEAGLGKSTLLEYVRDAIAELGFTDTGLSANMKFGMGRVAEADLAYRDDLTVKQQRDMLESNELKTIISNGVLKVEEKGARSRDCQSKATLIALTNNYSINQFFGMDAGSISRFHFLYTYSSAELDRVYPDFDGRTQERWDYLSSKYAVNKLELGCYLLACAAEIFLSAIGYEITANGITQKGKDRSEAILNGLAQKYHYKPFVSHYETLVISIGHMAALSIALAGCHNDDVKQRMLRNCENSSFGYELLSESLRYYCESTTKEAYDIKGINKGCKVSIEAKSNDIKDARKKMSMPEAFATLTKELIHEDGSGYPPNLTHYVTAWAKVKPSIGKWCEDYTKAGFKDVTGNRHLKSTLDELAKLF